LTAKAKWKWNLTRTQCDTRVAHIAKLDSESQSVGRAAMLTDEGEITFAERVMPDELVFCIRHRYQVFTFSYGK